MSEALFPYYERELLFIRQLSQDFARRYPAAAGRLLLEPTSSGDPHVERMIESFALLAGRIHHKLDDEFPELTDGLLGVLYPHFLAPIPSMSVVQFVLDPARGQFKDGFTIPRHSRLRTAAVAGTPCRFRTAYDVSLWPVELAKASLFAPPFPRGYEPPRRTAAALRLEFNCPAQQKFSDLSLDTLRLYLAADGQVAAALYGLIFNHVTQVVFRPLDAPGVAPLVFKPEECLTQVGFNLDEGLVPYGARSFPGYRLLSELFTFREKFMFLDLGGWARACRAGFQRRAEVILFLDQHVQRLEEWVDTTTLRLGCSPVVNLFEQVSEPIPLTESRFEYPVTPDVSAPLGMEVYSVDRVLNLSQGAAATKEYFPFYSFSHRRSRAENEMFWSVVRRPSGREGDRGTEVSLRLLDLNFQPHLPAESTVIVHTTCTNRDLPNQLQYAGERLYFELESAAPLSGIRCLRPPTPPLRPPSRKGRYWALMSHLSLNYLSLVDGPQARDSFCELLRLYDFSDPAAGQQQLSEITRQLIDGISSVQSRRVIGRCGAQVGGFCRGVEVTIEFDEQKYVGTGVFLFASVLERFLGLYASINSFSKLVAKTTQTEIPFKRWPPRAGEQQLL